MFARNSVARFTEASSDEDARSERIGRERFEVYGHRDSDGYAFVSFGGDLGYERVDELHLEFTSSHRVDDSLKQHSSNVVKDALRSTTELVESKFFDVLGYEWFGPHVCEAMDLQEDEVRNADCVIPVEEERDELFRIGFITVDWDVDEVIGVYVDPVEVGDDD